MACCTLGNPVQMSCVCFEAVEQLRSLSETSSSGAHNPSGPSMFNLSKCSIPLASAACIQPQWPGTSLDPTSIEEIAAEHFFVKLCVLTVLTQIVLAFFRSIQPSVSKVAS